MQASQVHSCNSDTLNSSVVADLCVMLALMAGRNGGIGYSLVQDGKVCMAWHESFGFNLKTPTVAKLLVGTFRPLRAAAEHNSALSDAHCRLHRLRSNSSSNPGETRGIRYNALPVLVEPFLANKRAARRRVAEEAQLEGSL